MPVTRFPDVSRAGEGELREWVAHLVLMVNGLEEQVDRLRAEARAREESLGAELAAERARGDGLADRVEELSRRLGRDSSNSSRPPSSDGPYRKPRDRSLRHKTGRRPGKQPGAGSVTLRQSAAPDVVIECPPAVCGRCGADLSGQEVAAVQKRQVFEASPPPPPAVTEYRVQSKSCPGCGQVSAGLAPAGVTGRVQYGPRVHAAAALATCGHYLPVGRAAALGGSLTGVAVSAGFTAGVRGKAAALLAPFMDRVRELLRAAPVLHADETPARAAGKLRYVHVACTEFLTAMHAGDRSKDAIGAGRVLSGYGGVIVRDGYAGYDHLTDALHAWCGAHGLRDLKAVAQAGPGEQAWARDMAQILVRANAAAGAARAAGRTRLSDGQQAAIRARYRAAAAAGTAANRDHRTGAGRDALTLARRFARHEDMILRFTTDLAVGFTNNQAERDIRPVKIAQHASGGTWRTPARPGRLRRRPLLPVHRRQMGHPAAGRPHPPVHRRPLAPARSRTQPTSHNTHPPKLNSYLIGGVSARDDPSGPPMDCGKQGRNVHDNVTGREYARNAGRMSPQKHQGKKRLAFEPAR